MFKLANPFKKSNSPLVGIDISSSAVKVVELGIGQSTAMRLEKYAIEPLERGAVTDGAIEKPEAVADALGRALRKAGIKAKDAALALPTSAVITKKIILPAGLTEDDYELQVESEASQYIPFSIDEVNLDFQIIGPAEKSEGDLDVLLAASRKEKVIDRVSMAEMCGLKAIVMDIESYAARAALDHATTYLANGAKDKIVAVFDIGHSLTKLTIILNEQTVFEREQAFGGSQLTQDIVRLYGITPEEADVRKRSGDLPDNFEADVLNPFVDQLATDAARSLQFFFTSTPYTKVDHVLLAGGSAVIPGLVEAVAEKAQVTTEVVSPFQGMEVASNVREKQLRLDSPALLVACGLAMRRFDQ
jgi:type IV pilus assembly protein PilM